MRSVSLKMRTTTIVVVFGLLLSCSKENHQLQVEALSAPVTEAAVVNPIDPRWNSYLSKIKAKNAAFQKTDQFYKKYFSAPGKSAAPSACNASVLNKVVDSYFKDF